MISTAVETDVPLFPLNTVLFPEGALPLRVFEARYMDMARNALRTSSPFGVCLIREGKEVGAPAVPAEIGTLAEIIDCDMQQLGVLLLKTRGVQRFRITGQRSAPQGLILASIERLPDEPDSALPARFEPCAKLLRALAENTEAGAGESPFHQPYRFDSARWVSQRLTEVLPIPLPIKQKLLELNDSAGRLEVLHHFLEQRGLILK